ncbi:MAG: gluconate 2-dehydrogenase subunit 3 family protein [Saprospiraceae bacterium]|nr:gluconate 2-dehydrogenase subunit 3 family protein [Saprospiraceae bacterium]
MIKRRSALSKIALGVAGMVSMPAWAHSWSPSSLRHFRYLSLEDETLLAAITDTIIPKTDTPGALELGVHHLIQKIIVDCYDVPAQATIRMGLVLTDAVSIGDFGDSFTKLSPDQRLAVLKKMSLSEYPDQKNFIAMIKRLTIDGYMRSEYVMTNITKFEFAPNRYYGCVPVKA